MSTWNKWSSFTGTSFVPFSNAFSNAVLSRLENGTQFFGLFLEGGDEDAEDSEEIDEADDGKLMFVKVFSRLALRIAIGSTMGLSMAWNLAKTLYLV